MAVVLVTGPTGQLGREVVDQLSALRHSVIALCGSAPDDTMPVDHWIHWSHEQASAVPLSGIEIDAVIHLAAQTSAYEARRDPPTDVQRNVAKFVSLLESLRERDRPAVVVTAGAATELGVEASLLDDTLTPDPTTFYDVAKVAQWLYLRQYCLEGWLRGAHIRFTNVYGGHGSGIARHRAFINRSIDAALNGDPLTLYRGVNGRRDLLHVSDAARALVQALDLPLEGAATAYVVGSGESISLHEALTRIARHAAHYTGSFSKINIVDPPQHLYGIEMRDVVVDSTRFRVQATWEPSITFDQGVSMYIQEALER